MRGAITCTGPASSIREAGDKSGLDSMRICFVCLGNICRSPTAEGVMRKLVRDERIDHKVAVDSAGTGGWHVGELPDERAREAAGKRGYTLDHRARQFKPDDLDRFELVLAMDLD